MTRAERTVNLVAVFGPFVILAAVLPLAWQSDLLGWSDLVVFAVMYLLTGFGVTIGYHRLLTHRAFQTHKWVEYVFAVLGSLSLQGSVLDWVADHRKHHAHTDQEGDPHSPHGHGGGIKGTLSGLWYAHAGWLWHTQGQARWDKYAKELYEDPTMRRINRAFQWLALATLAIPFVLGFLLTQSLHGALTALLWGGVVRIAILHHITWSVNSVCHFFGRRRFAVEDHSTNVWWLAVPSLGEAWHHNHHAFPRSAHHGLGRFEVDLTGYVIAGMKRIGLAWDVVRITPERQQAKLAGAERHRPATTPEPEREKALV